MNDIDPKSLRTFLAEQNLMFLADQPVVYHCHHFNLFLDQTIDDALGTEASQRLRMRAGREFSHQLIAAVCKRAEAETPPERIRLATELFRAMGHGKLEMNADSTGGSARGTFLHYGHAWHEKYGSRVRRREPADAFAAGFAAAAIEVAYDLPAGSVDGHELECVAMRAPGCAFKFNPSAELEATRQAIGPQQSLAVSGPSIDGIGENIIEPVCRGLQEFTAGVAGDERGVVEAFGVFVTMHQAGYYNRISYDAVDWVAKHAPQSVSVLEDLLRESGHVCVFNTFGGILLSPEWEGLVGPLTEDPRDIVVWCMAIARAFGFGHWAVTEFEPERRLVLRTPTSYESVFYRTRHGLSSTPNEYMLQGAALATAQLAHRVRWKNKPRLTPEYYQELFKGGVPWKAVQTKAVVRGDAYSEVVVTKVGAE